MLLNCTYQYWFGIFLWGWRAGTVNVWDLWHPGYCFGFITSDSNFKLVCLFPYFFSGLLAISIEWEEQQCIMCISFVHTLTRCRNTFLLWPTAFKAAASLGLHMVFAWRLWLPGLQEGKSQALINSLKSTLLCLSFTGKNISLWNFLTHQLSLFTSNFFNLGS